MLRKLDAVVEKYEDLTRRLSDPSIVSDHQKYQKYSKELQGINDEKFEMIHSYAQNWRSMSNDDALIFMRRWLEIDEKVTQLRSKYLLLVRDALPGKKAATFFQLDERISMMINLEIASQLPLLHGTPGQRQTTPPMQ